MELIDKDKQERTSQMQRKVLQHLTESGNVSYACKRAGVSRETYYTWKKEDKIFAEDAKLAIDYGKSFVNDLAPFPEHEALEIMSRVCDAVAYLHAQGIIHRDLKPQNIMLCYDGSLRVMDFGIAKAAAAKRLTFGGFSPTMGTPDYMAPEQVKGQRGDERTDIYSLGAILYEMLTGHLPFEGQNAFAVMNARLVGDPVAPRTHQPSIRPQVEEIVLHAMSRTPSDRYASAEEMKAELDDPSRVTVTGRVTRLQAPVAWKSRWRVVRTALLVALIPIALFFLFFLMLSRNSK